MDTLKELVNYCKIEHPVGALMLTGEWGCGKTYLINTEILYLIFNYPHKHYTFKHFEV